MDRLTKQKVERLRLVLKLLTDYDSSANEDDIDALCDLALQSLSQEAVRDGALEEVAQMAQDRAASKHDDFSEFAHDVRALKREPNAAAQVSQTLAASIGRESDVSSEGSPAPAAPDAASMVKRAIKEMRFFQSVRSRVPADAQYDEWIALLAWLGQRIETRKESEHPSNYEFPPAPGASDE